MIQRFLPFFFFLILNLKSEWKEDDLLGDFYSTETNWIYSLKYKGWYYISELNTQHAWLFHESFNSHFKGFIYLSNDIKPYSYFVPSYIATDSKSLCTLGTWLYYDGDKYLYWNNQLDKWSANIFTVVWNQYYQSTNGGWENNELGRFAWDDAYALDGLAIMNEQMQSTEIVEIGDSIIARFYESLNSKKKITDEITGEFKEGWASTRYTDGKYHTWNVHTSYLLHAIGQFYLTQSNLPNHKITQLEEIFTYMEDDWVSLNMGGFFNEVFIEKNLNIDIPLNMSSLCGCACLTLYNLTKKEKYLSYAKDIFLHIQNNVEIINDCAIWPYHPNMSENAHNLTRGDDISHGAHVIRFIKMCKDQGLIPKEGLEYEKFENTFRNLFRKDGTLNYYTFAIDEKYKQRDYYCIPAHWAIIAGNENFGLFKDYNAKLTLNFDPTSFLNHFGRDLVLNYILLNLPTFNQ